MPIPKYEDSVEVLEWIGLTNETAIKILGNYNRYDPGPYNLLDYVYGHVRDMALKFRHLPDVERMFMMGIRRHIQEAILHPHHTKAFQTQTLLYWIEDTLRINDRTLELLNQRSISPAVENPPRSCPSTAAATFRAEVKDSETPGEWAMIEAERKAAPHGHTRLWKATTAAEMEEWIDDDGNIDMGKLYTYSGGDFNPEGDAFYWSKDEECAGIFRKYAEARCEWAETWMISIDVPDSFLNSLNTKHLWFTNKWKHYVWLCRTKRSIPPYLRSYREEAELIVGPVCARNSNSLKIIKEDDVHTTITEDWVMVLSNGEVATQYVVMKRDAADAMAVQIKGKVHVEITASLQSRNLGKLG